MFRRRKTKKEKAAQVPEGAIPLANQGACARLLKERLDSLGLEESHRPVYYKGLSTFLLSNRFIHLDVNISTRQLIVSTIIHEVVSDGTTVNTKDRIEAFNANKVKSNNSVLGFRDSGEAVILTRTDPVTTLQSDDAFEDVLVSFMKAASEADTLFLEHKNHHEQTKEQRRTRQDSGFPSALKQQPKA
mmetsp:Transcript_19117/g.44544  ORF Transcript_19117/g.44544 Transcript_19117/m.44544 type:complete len:188 (+) Transcript_19117:68-631(+)